MSNDDGKVYASELSGAACFAWGMAVGSLRLITEGQCTCNGTLVMLQGCEKHGAMYFFNEAFRLTFGVNFDEAPRSLWLEMYQKGLKELADHGLVEMGRTAEGSWEPKAIHEERFVRGKKVWSQ